VAANADEDQSTLNAGAVNSDEQLQLGDVDKLPPADAPEASGLSATRYTADDSNYYKQAST